MSYAGRALMTVAEAAERYFQGCTEGFVRKLCRCGKLGDLVRLGSKWLIPENGIVKFLNAHRIKFDPASGRVPDPMATPKRLANLVPFRNAQS